MSLKKEIEGNFLNNISVLYNRMRIPIFVGWRNSLIVEYRSKDSGPNPVFINEKTLVNIFNSQV